MRHGPQFVLGQVDTTKGLGGVLARLGLIIRTLEIKHEYEEIEFSTGLPRLICGYLPVRDEKMVNFETILHRDAALTICFHQDEDGNVDYSKPVAIELDHEDSTREIAEEVMPTILELLTKHTENGTFSHRAAAMLGMLLMEMLWAVAA